MSGVLFALGESARQHRRYATPSTVAVVTERELKSDIAEPVQRLRITLVVMRALQPQCLAVPIGMPREVCRVVSESIVYGVGLVTFLEEYKVGVVHPDRRKGPNKFRSPPGETDPTIGIADRFEDNQLAIFNCMGNVESNELLVRRDNDIGQRSTGRIVDDPKLDRGTPEQMGNVQTPLTEPHRQRNAEEPEPVAAGERARHGGPHSEWIRHTPSAPRKKYTKKSF